jgi:hypothetical protein
MIAMNAVAYVIGVTLLVVYIGVLVWAIAAWPFTVIVALVFAMMIYDFVRTGLREGNGGLA